MFHAALVDLLRSFLLIPLSLSILDCTTIGSCSSLETSFLLLVTASTVSRVSMETSTACSYSSLDLD